MNTTIGRNEASWKFALISARALMVAGFLFGAACAFGQPAPYGDGPDTNILAWWSFQNTTNWDTDQGFAPMSFTNLNSFPLGEGNAMVLDTNVPAWLQYYVYEPGDAATNLAINLGSLILWFAPDWASTSQGGTGPGEPGRLLEVGSYTANSSYGWWSIYVDALGNNLYFSTQTNNLSSTYCTFLTAPISWTSNYFHFVALTYSATNTALYLDGVLATNGSPLTVYPGTNVLAGGLFIGSDSNGVLQAHGMIGGVAAYDCQLSAVAINTTFMLDEVFYVGHEAQILQAPSNPSTQPTTPDVITGSGYLQSNGVASVIYGTNQDDVWITNLSATPAGTDSCNLTFSIEGGASGYAYDVFATSALEFPITNAVWAWMGQGCAWSSYTLTNLSSSVAFILLGTPLDSDNDGLTDAYELLVSHTDPHNRFSNLDGILDGWEVLLGLNPHISNLTTLANRAAYAYTPADWLYGVSGIKSGTIVLDNEGNVKSVSQ